MRIILASASPRRRELLHSIYSDFEIIVADINEDLPDGMAPEVGVRILAERKGAAVLSRVKDPSAVIISSDTLVELDGIALGKPQDEMDARRMLRALSGNEHFVRTGVAVHYGGLVASTTASTKVVFKALTDEQINTYVESGEPMDKAGSYGIQGAAGVFVERIEGDMDTVIGLSLSLVKKLVDELTS